MTQAVFANAVTPILFVLPMLFAVITIGIMSIYGIYGKNVTHAVRGVIVMAAVGAFGDLFVLVVTHASHPTWLADLQSQWLAYLSWYVILNVLFVAGTSLVATAIATPDQHRRYFHF